jgi:hypothetical protein
VGTRCLVTRFRSKQALLYRPYSVFHKFREVAWISDICLQARFREAASKNRRFQPQRKEDRTIEHSYSSYGPDAVC